MLGADQLSELLCDVHIAALQPSHWKQALTRIVHAMDADKCALLTAQHKSPLAIGSDPADVESYNAYFGRIDPVAAALEHSTPGKVLSMAMVATPAEQLRHEFFCDWALPCGIRNATFSTVLHGNTETCAIVIASSVKTEAWSFAQMRNLNLLMPHLQLSLRVQGKLSSLTGERDLALEAFTVLQHGVLFIATGGKVIFSNPSADALLGKSKRLRIDAAGRLRALNEADNSRLSRLIDTATTIVNGSSPCIGGSIAITRERNRPYVVHVLPLAPHRTQAPVQTAAAIVLIVDPGHDAESPRLLRRLFGLTAAEARVVECVFRNAGLQHVADELGVSLSTVRVHLQHVFEKTNTHRQVDLVRLVHDVQASVRHDILN